LKYNLYFFGGKIWKKSGSFPLFLWLHVRKLISEKEMGNGEWGMGNK
jgi:hypothetical protein